MDELESTKVSCCFVAHPQGFFSGLCDFPTFLRTKFVKSLSTRRGKEIAFLLALWGGDEFLL